MMELKQTIADCVLCADATLLEAFNRLEVIEEAAQMTFYAQQLGESHELSTTQCHEIDEMMGCHG